MVQGKLPIRIRPLSTAPHARGSDQVCRATRVTPRLGLSARSAAPPSHLHCAPAIAHPASLRQVRAGLVHLCGCGSESARPAEPSRRLKIRAGLTSLCSNNRVEPASPSAPPASPYLLPWSCLHPPAFALLGRLSFALQHTRSQPPQGVSIHHAHPAGETQTRPSLSTSPTRLHLSCRGLTLLDVVLRHLPPPPCSSIRLARSPPRHRPAAVCYASHLLKLYTSCSGLQDGAHLLKLGSASPASPLPRCPRRLTTLYDRASEPPRRHPPRHRIAPLARFDLSASPRHESDSMSCRARAVDAPFRLSSRRRPTARLASALTRRRFQHPSWLTRRRSLLAA
ncbi:hypothetical protein ZWY2020_011094 [Hordeum vulgare]|nr:hypothetical protein ZWY2020_011094 [Hordeum vulgare]